MVLDPICEAPANGYLSVRTQCFAYGDPVCRACSRIVGYYGYGKRRLCADCINRSDLIVEAPK